MTRAAFITFEGGEGAGKSTQVERLREAIERSGTPVIATREPGGSPGAEEIRRLLVDGEPDRWDAATEALLHFAARRDHLVRTILPALEAGTWVVSDRFADSTIAYQGYAQGLDRETLGRLYQMTVGDFAPDLTVILDIPVAKGLARAGGRGGPDRYERMGKGFHERLRAGFLEIAGREPERCVVIDGARDADSVHADVVAALRERVGLPGDGDG